VTNAIKFTQMGGVTLTADLIAEGGVLIRVRDTGVGIAAESLERVFDEFAQLANSGRDPTKGWGLGLAICRRLVELMGGAITVESHLNRGSVFCVRLPPSCALNRSEGGPDGANCGQHRKTGLAGRCT
jgi:signal transduction histidine kinase